MFRKLFVVTLTLVMTLSGCVQVSVEESDSTPLDWPEIEQVSWGAKYVPELVGHPASFAVWFHRTHRFGDFSEIYDVDSGKPLKIASESDVAELLDGKYVCSQSLAPGADVAGLVQMSMAISIAESCKNRKAAFQMGPAAEANGRIWVPAALNGCTIDDGVLSNCEYIEGQIRGFEDQEEGGHRIALVETGLGTFPIELAWIDIASDVCQDFEDPASIWASAIETRNTFLSDGTQVILNFIESDRLSAFFHYSVDNQNFLKEGLSASVNSMLVYAGSWVPTSEIFEWKLDTSNPEEIQLDWVQVGNFSYGSKEAIYAENLALHADANIVGGGVFGNCKDEKYQTLLAIFEQEEAEKNKDDDKDRLILVKPKKEEESEPVSENTSSQSKDESNWLDCEGDAYYDWPTLCDGGDRLVRETLAGEGPYGSWATDSSGASGGGSSGGSKCHYVNGHYRKGTWVNGYWRGC